jgi:AcrR family transcriptional regulator
LENRSAAVNAPSPLRPPSTELPNRQRARRTNNPLASIETNTARGRRVADLVRAYLRALGNPADIERQAAVIAAAELQVLAEATRATALKAGALIDLDQVIRVQGAADRAIRRLGIEPGVDRRAKDAAWDVIRQSYSLNPSADDDSEMPTSEPALMDGTKTAQDETPVCGPANGSQGHSDEAAG